MATKVKPCRLNVSWTPQVWNVPVYVDEDNFQWWAGWWWGWTWDVTWPNSSTDWDVVLFDWATWKLIKDSWVSLSDYQEKLTAWTNIQISASNVISATAWSDIVYATQAEYNALLPWAASDWKHYFIYSTSGGWRFTPWVNTVAYYPFDNDILDHSWNNKDFTGSWYSFANNMITTTSDLTWPIVTPENTTWDRTINMWSHRMSGNYIFRSSDYWSEWHLIATDWENWSRPWASLHINWWKRNRPSASELPVMWDIILMTWTKTGTTMKLYINGVLTSTNSSLGNSTWVSQLWITKSVLSAWTFWEIIVEDKIWTDQEISDYYDLTKSLYWIS